MHPTCQVLYLKRVYGSYPLPLAWKYEALADVLAGCVSPALHPEHERIDAMAEAIRLLAPPRVRDSDLGSDSVAPDPEDVARLYTAAYNMMCNSFGPEHGFAVDVERKLDRFLKENRRV